MAGSKNIIKLYEGGVYGSIEYVERKSLLIINDYRKGFEIGTVIKIDADGTEEELFSYRNNKDYALKNSEQIKFDINGESVSESEYKIQLLRNMPVNTSEFSSGIPMTTENIDKYCK